MESHGRINRPPGLRKAADTCVSSFRGFREDVREELSLGNHFQLEALSSLSILIEDRGGEERRRGASQVRPAFSI